jgi:hypothetical protein
MSALRRLRVEMKGITDEFTVFSSFGTACGARRENVARKCSPGLFCGTRGVQKRNRATRFISPPRAIQAPRFLRRVRVDSVKVHF